MHTEDEFNLFHNAVSPGGAWASAHGQPNFDQMAQWWSQKADGKLIFYKLREHLATYYKTWSEHRQEKQTIIASQPQRQPHEKRIRSINFVSRVLPPAKRHQPGISNNQIETISLAAEEIVVAQNVSLVEGTESTVIVQDVAMEDIVAPSFELTTHDVTMQDAVVPHSGLYSMAGDLNDINMQASVVGVLPPNQHFTPGGYVAFGGAEKARKRRCMICVEAGRDGLNCKGKNNRRHCEFNKVCFIN